jgi:hypothetical protein
MDTRGHVESSARDLSAMPRLPSVNLTRLFLAKFAQQSIKTGHTVPITNRPECVLISEVLQLRVQILQILYLGVSVLVRNLAVDIAMPIIKFFCHRLHILAYWGGIFTFG